MKLSEMKFGKARICMANLAVPIQTIAKHPAIKELFDRSKEQTAPDVALWVDCILTAMPVLFRDCERETMTVLCCLFDKTPQEVDEMTNAEVVAELKNSIDGELLKFFRTDD